MKQPTSIQINIPQPCSEDWDKMTPQAKGRFCDSCQKCVVDFTNYSDEELYQYIQQHKRGSICGHVHRSQLKRNISLPPQPHSQLYKWIMAAGLALVFVATPESKSFAQAPLIEYAAQQNEDSNTDTFSVRGNVFNENNEPIIGAVAKLFHEEKIIGGGVTDFDGNFIIKPVNAGNYNMTVTYVGYNEISLEVSTEKHVEVALTEPKAELEDIDIIMGYIVPLIDTFETTNRPTHIDHKHTVPLIDSFEGGNTKTFTAEEIERGAY